MTEKIQGENQSRSFKEKFQDYLELTKPRICTLALIMASLGFFMASEGSIDWVRFVISVVGIGMVGASSGVLNQFLERELDSRMWRTLNRPIPSGRVSPLQALRFGLALAFGGEAILLIGVNPVTAVLGALTLLFYLGIYTPSKQVSSLSTLVGAIPGAVPPLLGWTAAQGTIGKEGMLLFSILFLWQIPHFLAIAWIYREDYLRAEFPILTVVDESGTSTSKQIIIYTLVLLPFTLIPSAWGITGRTYFYGALVLGLGFLIQGLCLAYWRNLTQARRLFLASLLYLPLLGVLMAWDRL